MAEQSQQNVVVQPLSTGALSSVDVSVNNSTNPVAPAAVEKSQAPAKYVSQPEPVPESRLLETQTSAAENGVAEGYNASRANGPIVESRDVDGIEEGSIKSAGVDGSVGSDTDNSKAKAANAAPKDIEGQVPRYSAKKSASFKPVSVTKNFLAKAGSSSTPAKASNEKANPSAGASPAPSGQNALRPRLVAKSASGQRGSLPKSTSMADKSGSGAGPDPNQVWNRNRVSTPQATPKHLTDEELRQQYGIQLASRPDDSDDKGAKWADIDDEEDDWAPETIEWNDGTKINLAQAEAPTTPSDQNQDESMKEQAKVDATSKPNDKEVKPTTVGPNATVLKLGASSHQRASSSSGKGAFDKPMLVAKPAAPAPVKSPWASLPAVDKVPPVAINPPPQPPAHSRFSQRDLHGFDAMLPPPQPGPQAKEIAADDFSRFSRETSNGVPRELFVPQSGRYEPVNENRRGSTKKESTFRPPSLLQRPSQHEQQGPAEPSAAFQTHRSQQDTASWTRRRASSTVSGESGKFARRPSFAKPLESPNVGSRRNSQFDPFAPAGSNTRSSQREESPAQSHEKSITSQSPTLSLAPESGPRPLPEQGSAEIHEAQELPHEDKVAVQKKLMREKREAAIKRKKEEEAREEAERRERIRVKMEKLGMTDEKTPKKDTGIFTSKPPAKDEKVPNLKDLNDLSVGNDSSQTATTVVPPSPPKPPIPSASGPPQQYGLMKVHASQPLGATASHTHNADRSLLDTVTDPRPARALPSQSPFANNDLNEHKLESTAVPNNEGRSSDASVDARAWSNLQQVASPYANWSNSGGMATHSSPGANLWGPPSNHRALGNGDFQNNLSRSSLRPPQPHISQQHFTSPPPQPIGTPRQIPSTRGFSSSSSSDLLPRSIIEDSQTIPAYPPTESDSLNLPNHLSTERPSSIKTPHENSHPAPSPVTMGALSQAPPQELPQTGRAAWVNFSANAGRIEREVAQREAQEHTARMAEQQLSGIVPDSQLPSLTETWKQVKRGGGHGARQVVKHIKTQDEYGTIAAAQRPPIGELPKNSVVPHARSRYSDFFDQEQHASTVGVAASRSLSPPAPPPDSIDHPAYTMATPKPLVNLPGSKPKGEKPIVKLPPPSASNLKQQTQIVDSRVQAAPARGAVQPIVSNPSWQDRFNGLLGRKGSSPEKKSADTAIAFSSSKEPLELAFLTGVQPTAVTLPPEVSAAKKDLRLKLVEDENALFEERDFGSVPAVKLPDVAPVSLWEPAKEPTHHYKRSKILSLKDNDVFSIPKISPPYSDLFHGKCSVFLPGMQEAIVKPFHRPQSNTSARGGKSHSMRNKHRQSSKPARDLSSLQDSSAAPPKQGSAGKSLSQSQSTGASRSSTKPHSGGPQSWARRVSAVAQ